MSSFQSYEQNLHSRLVELRQGDRAYEMHGDAILETLPYEPLNKEHDYCQRILDVGCGLGFLATKLAQSPLAEAVVGIDPSRAAIQLAREEHAASNLEFITASAQDFPAQLKELGQQPFDRAILNMVLHSTDDDTCLAVLGGVRQSLASPAILTLIVPDQSWLQQKLIEKAQSTDMDKTEAIDWISSQLLKPSVDITFGIHGQPEYSEPITVYNRSLQDYGALLLRSGFGLDIDYQLNGREEVSTFHTAFWEWNDHTSGYNLSNRDRHILMIQPVAKSQ